MLVTSSVTSSHIKNKKLLLPRRPLGPFSEPQSSELWPIVGEGSGVWLLLMSCASCSSGYGQAHSGSGVIGPIIIATSFSLAQLVVGRLVLGVAVGGAAIICPLYITELAPTRQRGRVSQKTLDVCE